VLLGSERGTKKPLGTPLVAYFQNRRLHTLTRDEIAGWFTQRVRSGAQDTKHRVSKNARAFLRFCREQGYTDLDLAGAIDPYRAGRGRIDWLEWNDVHHLLDAIPELRFKMAAAWLFYTGCRVGEAVRAQQRDVRLMADRGLYQWSIPDTKTHIPRTVWLPDVLAHYIEESRQLNSPRANWPILWDCDGRGFSRVENPAAPITAKTINAALAKAAGRAAILVKVTAHTAKHTYCTNWITEKGDTENSMERLSRQVGTSVAVLRKTYVHVQFTEADWEHIHTLGKPMIELFRGRGRTFESCREHGSTMRFLEARNAEKCAIRPSYSASATAGEANEPCPEGAGSEGLLGLADRGSRGLGTAKDRLLQDRPALVARLIRSL
jgi:integrase